MKKAKKKYKVGMKTHKDKGVLDEGKEKKKENEMREEG